jgi:hypothetical protein
MHGGSDGSMSRFSRRSTSPDEGDVPAFDANNLNVRWHVRVTSAILRAFRVDELRIGGKQLRASRGGLKISDGPP